MPLSFEDANGRNGRVTETFEIVYAGSWREDIEACVRRIENDHHSDDPDRRADDPYTRLILELPEEAPIIEIEQTDVPE
jgi:hypothetical protein